MEHEPSSVHYAGFWRRLAAHIIDSIVLNLGAWLGELLIFGGMYAVYYLLQQRSGEAIKPYGDAFAPLMVQIVNAVIYLLLCLPYFVWGQFRYGTTPGKKLFSVYVVSEKGLEPMTLKQSWIRFFGYLASYLTFGCGFVMAAFHPQKRALHDLIAGTVSIVKKSPRKEQQ